MALGVLWGWVPVGGLAGVCWRSSVVLVTYLEGFRGPQKPKGTGKLHYMGRGRRAGAE